MQGCDATITEKTKSGQVLFRNNHNHFPVRDSNGKAIVQGVRDAKMSTEIKKQVVAALQVDGSPTKIAEIIPGVNVVNVKQREKTSQFSSDILANIHSYKGFLRSLNTFPTLEVALFGATGLELMKTQEQFSVDGIHKLVEGNAITTIVTTKLREVIVPVAFLISSSCTTTTYEKFFRILQENGMNPTSIFSDLESALQHALINVFGEKVLT